MKIIRGFFKEHWVFICIFLLALLLRCFKLETLTTYGGDQGIDFITVRDMVVYHKWTLLGIKTSVSAFFQGPVYLYLLFPFFVFFQLNPVAGPAAAVVISAVTIILLYITAKRYFSKRTALFAAALFAVSPEFVMYGNTPLYQHFLPLFIVLSLYIFFFRKKNFLTALLLGLSTGIGLEIHLLNITLLFAFMAYFIFYKRDQIIGYTFGVITGCLPTILFELRHQFLNTKLFFHFEQTQKTSFSLFTIIKQWTDGASRFLGGNNSIIGTGILLFLIISLIFVKLPAGNKKDIRKLALLTLFFITILSLKFSAFAPHYILPFWVMSLILLPLLLDRLLPKRAGLIIMIIILVINLLTSVGRLTSDHGYSMPEGLSMKKIETAGKIIGEDSKTHNKFNVASLLDGNTQNFPLRYSVLVHGGAAGDISEYPKNDVLYITARSDQGSLYKTKLWEVVSFKPFHIGKKWDLGNGIYLYRIERDK